ncbi:unnamed protein product, partial [Bubo scandiacus]
SAALLGSTHHSSSATDRKQYNWQSMHTTSAAIRVVSGLKSKTYKEQDIRELSDTNLHGTPVQTWLLPDLPYPVEGVFNLFLEQWHHQLMFRCVVGLSGMGQTATWDSKEHLNF